MPNQFPFHAGFKTDGTSLEAAEAITPTVRQAHEDLLALLRIYPDGLTADGAGYLLNWTPFYARPRMSELKTRGLVKKIGRAINASSGKSVNLWGIS